MPGREKPFGTRANLRVPSGVDGGMSRLLRAGERSPTLASAMRSRPNVEKVPLLAARWSLDPAAIDERLLAHARGVAGEPSHRF